MNSKGCHGRYCISSTHPLRDATNALDCFDTYYLDFNPRTPYGMRPRHGNDYYMSILYFNPRTPYGMRLIYNYLRDVVDEISIHAPLTGCGKKTLILSATQLYFNPRTPYGMRHRVADGFMRFISIHAPLTGCDSLLVVLQSHNHVFQSTHPLRDATIGLIRTCYVDGISIHAPLTGCDKKEMYLDAYKKISIHAPLTGCDWEKLHCISFYYDFNPRTPYGMRP